MVKNKEWSEDELKASVKTYIEMLSKEQSEISFIKKIIMSNYQMK